MFLVVHELHVFVLHQRPWGFLLSHLFYLRKKVHRAPPAQSCTCLFGKSLTLLTQEIKSSVPYWKKWLILVFVPSQHLKCALLFLPGFQGCEQKAEVSPSYFPNPVTVGLYEDWAALAWASTPSVVGFLCPSFTTMHSDYARLSHPLSSVQFSCSVLSLFSPMNWKKPQASLFINNSQSLLKLVSIESVMPSNYLILCCRLLLLLPSIFPSIRVSFNESALCIRWPNYWSFSFSISPSNEYSGLISLKMD